MIDNKMLDEITDIFKEVLDLDDVVVYGETVASDIPEWDSLNHIQLIVAIEKHFKVKFTSMEIMSWKNVDDMCNGINQKFHKS